MSLAPTPAGPTPPAGGATSPPAPPELAVLERIARRLDDLADAAAAGPVPRLLLRLDEVAGATGLDARTIQRERSAGRFPPPDVQLGKRPLWSPETVRAWIAKGGRP